MSLLGYNSTPAERARYCSFAENLESSWHVQENGGVITGTPLINFGATLNGTTDYITYRLQGHEFNSANISFLVDLYPDFAYNADSNYYICDTLTTRYYVAKLSNANNNVIQLRIGGTSINIAAASYSAYWGVGIRNTLVVSGTSGNTNAWLNSAQVLTNNATVWAPGADVATLVIGAQNNGANKFDGRITSLEVFKSLLTAEDAYNYYHYGYMG